MSVVSANYFDAIGVRPTLGRAFRPEEDFGRNAHPVVVIGYQMWQERFHGDPQIIGKTQMLNGMPHVIIGVAPEGFYGTFVGWAMQLWVPQSMQERFDPMRVQANMDAIDDHLFERSQRQYNQMRQNAEDWATGRY